MRIVNLQNFMTLPEGTIFTKFYPSALDDELCIKGVNNGDRDFYKQRFLEVEDNNPYLKLVKAMESGESFGLNLDCEGREGFIEDHQLFVVYERKDVLQLMARLEKAYVDSGMSKQYSAELDKFINGECDG